MGILGEAFKLAKAGYKASKEARALKKIKNAPAAVARKIREEKDVDKATLIAKRALNKKALKTGVKSAVVAGTAGAAVGYSKGKKSEAKKSAVKNAAAYTALSTAAKKKKKVKKSKIN